jgi:acyl carrier protein
MREKLLAILEEIAPDVDFEKETALIDDGLLESFDIVNLVSELNDEFDIEIRPKDLQAANFNSVDAMVEMIERLQED